MITGPGDPRFKQRLMLSLALSIALAEILIGASQFLHVDQEKAEGPAPSTRVVIEVRTPEPTATPRPEPTPRATPPPKVTPSVHREVAAPVATVVAKAGGHHGAPKLEVHNKTVHHKEVKPIWWAAPHHAKTVANMGGTSGGVGAGSGTGAGTGAGTDTGIGGGTGGNGNGAVNADTPCGGPFFTGLRAKYNPQNHSFAEDVRVELRLGNGQIIKGDFHYPWRYPSEQDNPFSPNWKGGPDDPIPAQTPPPGFNVANEPDAVRLTLKYTLPNGLTRMLPCPN